MGCWRVESGRVGWGVGGLRVGGWDVLLGS